MTLLETDDRSCGFVLPGQQGTTRRLIYSPVKETHFLTLPLPPPPPPPPCITLSG